MGRLEIICGPMFSGKSEELLRRLRRAEIAGLTVAAVKLDFDTRYKAKKIVSHAGSERSSLLVSNPEAIKLQAFAYDVVGVDEVQFFGEGIVEVLQDMAQRQVVIASGLDMTYRGEPFGEIPTLLAIADKIDKLTAVCHSCGKDATLTQRLLNGKPAPATGDTIQVGGLDSYEARCRSCWEVG